MDKAEVIKLLQATGDDQADLFARARSVRSAHVGDSVIVRGVTEVTNLCRVNCSFCPMRRDNSRENDTFRLSVEDIVNTAQAVRESGINVFFLQGGEVPQTTQVVGDALPRVREVFDDNVEILLNLGVKPREDLAYLRDQGADSYILKHETSDPRLALASRGETLEHRLRCIDDLLDLGYAVGTGGIVGLPGQTVASIADDILLAAELGVTMCSFAPFRPAPDTPYAVYPPGDVGMTLNAIAISRLVGPSWLIPSVSALEASGSGGQRKGLDAGANVLTVNFSEAAAREKYLIYGKDRFIVNLSHVERIVESARCVRRGSSVLAPFAMSAGWY